MVATLTSLFAVLALASSSASAAQTRVLQRTFGSLSNPQGLAVDNSAGPSKGDVYVADTANNRVEKFSASGEFILMFGGDVNPSGLDHNVCTALEIGCQPGTKASTPGAFEHAQFLAIDQTTGDIYVGDTTDGLITKFDAEGHLITTWGNNGAGSTANGQLNGSATKAGSFEELAGVAVTAAGSLLVYDATSHVVSEFEAAKGVLLGEVELKLEEGSTPRGLAVDTAGDLFKANGDGSLEKFNAAGEDTGTVSPGGSGGAPGAAAFTVEPGGDLYVANEGGSLEHFAFNGSGEVIEPGGGTCPLVSFNISGCGASDSVVVGFAGAGIGVSVETGDSYLSDPGEGKVVQYGPLVTIPDVETMAAGAVAAVSVRLNGSVNPDGLALSECVFEYGTTTGYGQSAPCEEPDAAEVGEGTEPVEVHADVNGLTPGVVYHFRLEAGNANAPNHGGDESFETLPPPVIAGAAVTGLTAAAAVLEATVNPKGSQIEECVFEYGTSTGYGSQAPCVPAPAQIGAGTEPVAVSAAIGPLEASAHTYHWRLAARNPSGTTTSVDHTFLYPTAGAALPDNRAFEMVTPARKNGALIDAVSFLGNIPSIAADGQRVIAPTIQCFDAAESCSGRHANAIGSPYQFTRAASGWAGVPLAPPASEFPENAPFGYDADTGTALFSMSTPPFGEDDFYLRGPDGSFTDIGPNTPPEQGPQYPKGGSSGAELQAQTADFSHLVWQTEARWPFDESLSGTHPVYEYAGTGNTQPLLVGVTGGYENGENHNLITTCETFLGSAGILFSVPGLISSDGATVFFTAHKSSAPGCETGSGVNKETAVPVEAVYARVDGENAGAHTVALSRSRSVGEECPAGEGAEERACRERTSPSECGAGAAAAEVACRGAVGKPGDAEFLGASADGSRAFFTSTQQLTDTASEDSNPADSATTSGKEGCTQTVAVGGCNLYEYDFSNPAGRELVAASAGDSSGGGPRVQGVMALSPDGTHVYFVAKGTLATAANEQGQHAVDGGENLYLFERVCPGGEAGCASPVQRTVFIATLPEADHEEWTIEPGLPANVTPDGGFLVFLSRGRLTADDSSLSGAQQVFRYDAQTGQLVRVSVGDEGFNDNGNPQTPSPCGHNTCAESAHLATPRQDTSSSRADPSMSDDGRFVFFQSPVALTAGALDDVQVAVEENNAEHTPVFAQNVYEWREGRVFLVSGGRDVSANNGGGAQCTFSSVCLLGSDASGSNVFFTTTQRLVGQDTDSELDIYDARVCTGASPCLDQAGVGPVECSGEGCEGKEAAPPVFGAPGSATLTGNGNLSPPSTVTPAVKPKPLTRAQKLSKALKACHKYKKKAKRVGCEKSAHKKYGPIKKKK